MTSMPAQESASRLQGCIAVFGLAARAWRALGNWGYGTASACMGSVALIAYVVCFFGGGVLLNYFLRPGVRDIDTRALNLAAFILVAPPISLNICGMFLAMLGAFQRGKRRVSAVLLSAIGLLANGAPLAVALLLTGPLGSD